MTRILIAWELGEAYGHFARCLQLAHGLVSRGYSVVLVFKDIRLPPGSRLPPNVTLLQAPVIHQAHPHQPLANYAALLQACGFSSTTDLAARIRAWQSLFKLTNPNIVIADHAPTACLAARLSDIPSLTVGNGFTIPPSETPWPSIRPWENIPGEVLQEAEQRLDDVTESAQCLLGYYSPFRMRELFGEYGILDTFAELDHYGERANGCYLGPIATLPQSRQVIWQDSGACKILAYLRPKVPGFKSIMDALRRIDAEVICVVPGLPVEYARRQASRRFRIALAPIRLPNLLVEADLSVGYGNCGFSTQSLLAGVPLLLSPRYVEQALIAHRVEGMGAGVLLDTPTDSGAICRGMESVIHETSYRQAAQEFRQRYRSFSGAQALEQTLQIIEKYIAAHSIHPPSIC